MKTDYVNVTELSGDEGSLEQLERMCHRYYWAGTYCEGNDVLEAACGVGPGAGYLAGLAKSYRAGDFSEEILEIARRHYGERIGFRQFDAQQMPFPDGSLDVVLLFEAIYYIPSAERFVQECRRVLREGGKVLIATANKDLFDFSASPHSYAYYGVRELGELFGGSGFETEFFGCTPVDELNWRQRALRPIKKVVVNLGLMPSSKIAKTLLKRLVFGKMVVLPAEITAGMLPYQEPVSLPMGEPDHRHKVVYCVATRAA